MLLPLISEKQTATLDCIPRIKVFLLHSASQALQLTTLLCIHSGSDGSNRRAQTDKHTCKQIDTNKCIISLLHPATQSIISYCSKFQSCTKILAWGFLLMNMYWDALPYVSVCNGCERQEEKDM